MCHSPVCLSGSVDRNWVPGALFQMGKTSAGLITSHSGLSSKGSAGSRDSVSISTVLASDSFVGGSIGRVGGGHGHFSEGRWGQVLHVADMISEMMSRVTSLEKFGVAGRGIEWGGLGVLWVILFFALYVGRGLRRIVVGLDGVAF